MKLLFLGTGAAGWLNGLDPKPEFFRRNSSALVDGELLIDFGDGVLETLDTYGCDRKQIKYIINTHKHADHYSEDALQVLKESGAELVEFAVGETKSFGKYTVTAFKGNHALEPTTHFIISDGEKELFYGLDGAWLMPGLFHEIIDRRVSTVVLEATYGFDVYAGVYEHNNLGMIVEIASVLNQYCDKIYLSHLSRVHHKDHEDIVREMEKYSVSVAFDGLEIEI